MALVPLDVSWCPQLTSLRHVLDAVAINLRDVNMSGCTSLQLRRGPL